LTNRFDETIAGTSGQPVSSGSPVFDHVVNKSTVLDNQISDLYKVASDRAGGNGVVDLSETFKMLEETRPSDSLMKGVISSIEGEAKRLGLLKPAVATNKKLLKTSSGEPKKFYHGTGQRFDQFSGTAYFTEDIEAAKRYMKESGKNQRMVEANLSIDRLASEKEIRGLANKIGMETDGVETFELLFNDSLMDKLKSLGFDGGNFIDQFGGRFKTTFIFNPEDIIQTTKNLATVGEAEFLRKFSNQLFNSTSDFGKVGLKRFRDSIDGDVTRSAGADIFQQARTAKTAFEKELRSVGASKFSKRKTSLVRDILEEKVDPEVGIESLVLPKKYRAKDLEDLKRYLDTGTPEQKIAGKQAWNDLRAETIDYIKNNSFVGPIDATGNQNLSRSALKGALKRIGVPKLKTLFTKEEQKFLTDMVKVSELLEPVRATQQGLGPSAQAVQSLMGSLKRRLSKFDTFAALLDIEFNKAKNVLTGKPVIRERTIPLKQIALKETAKAAGVAGAITATDQQRR
jgi:hypothetical protein